MADPSGFNNPRLGQAFGNIASIFAPPSAQDLYAYTRAAGERQKSQRAAALWEKAQDPKFDQGLFDRMNVAAGSYSPASSYWGVGVKDATDRRGQDVASADRRYAVGVESGDRRRGQDIQSGDNRYKVDQDNNTALTLTGLKERGDTERRLLDPVGEGQTRFVPPSVASAWQLPPVQIGAVKLNQGQKSVLPNGAEVQGNAKPLTDAEFKALVLQGMDPKQQQAAAFGSTPIETVIVNGKPQTMTRPEMVATGTPEAPKPGAVFNWKGGTATMGADGKLVDTQTGQVLPPGEGVQAPSGVQSKDPLGATTANQTEANRKAAGLQVMGQALASYKDLLTKNPGIVGLPGAVRGAAQNVVSVAQEFGSAFGNLSPDAKIGADQVAQIAGQITQGRDPAIAQLRVMQADLAYKWAQMQNPSGEVSRQAFERALETLSGGTLANNQSALEAVTAIEQALQRELAGVAALRNPQGAPRPAEPRPRAADANGNIVEWDGTNWLPRSAPHGPPNAPGTQTIQTPSGPVTIRPRQ